MKKSLLAAILFAAAVLLAGYVAFAFTAPTQAPPAGNAPTPLNVGSQTQTKQGGLNVLGEVRSNTLCIGGACKTAWPQELHASDVAAGGAVRGRSWEMGCLAKYERQGYCGGYYRKWVFFTEVGALYDWRGNVVNKEEADVIVKDCYEDSRCTPRTQRTVTALNCKSGWNTDSGHRIARAIEEACSPSLGPQCSRGFVCTQ